MFKHKDLVSRYLLRSCHYWCQQKLLPFPGSPVDLISWDAGRLVLTCSSVTFRRDGAVALAVDSLIPLDFAASERIAGDLLIVGGDASRLLALAVRSDLSSPFMPDRYALRYRSFVRRLRCFVRLLPGSVLLRRVRDLAVYVAGLLLR
jgi:hypothetical protein